MKKNNVEYTTIKINAKTAAKLRKFIKKKGGTIAGYSSCVLEIAMKADKDNDWVIKALEKEETVCSITDEWKEIKQIIQECYDTNRKTSTING